MSENKPLESEKKYRRDVGGIHHLGPTDEAVAELEAAYQAALQCQSKLEEQLRKKEAELAHVARVAEVGEMASGLVHELSEPLYAINNYVQGAVRRLEQGKCDPAVLLAAMKELATEAGHASAIISRVRSFVRKRGPHRSTTDVNNMVQEVLQLVGGDVRHLGIELKLDLHDNLPWVFVDTVQIQQCLLNLLRNALDAMREGPSGRRTLTVTTQMSDETAITVAVSDTGKGLLPEASERVFEPFFTTKDEGMGMGLSLARTIVRAHGGRIWATPNPGHGVTFQFTLPIAKEQ